MGSVGLDSTVAPQKDYTDEEACVYALQLASSSILPMTLKAAIELDLLEILVVGCGGYFGKPVMTAVEVASHLKSNNAQAAEMLDRILRLLASYNVVNCAVKMDGNGKMVTRSYGPAPVCRYLTKNEDGASLAPLVLMNQDKVLMETWYYLKDAVLYGGVPFHKAYGMTAFEYNAKDLRLGRIFNKAMMGHSVIFIKMFLKVYQGFDDINTLVDVGGGVGASISMITSKHSKMKGINFDLPHVIADAPHYPRVEHIAGDMFQSVPAGDAILLKRIMHDWSDEHCVTLLKNCHKTLPDIGKVIIVECVVPIDPNEASMAQRVFHADLIMLAHSPGGKERTEQEFKSLADLAGFSGFKANYVSGSMWAIELTKGVIGTPKIEEE